MTFSSRENRCCGYRSRLLAVSLATSASIVVDAREIDPPRLVHTHASIEVPQNAPLTRLRHHRPCDHCPAQLFSRRIRHQFGGGAALGMVMQEPAVRLIAECGVPGGAQDQAVPRLIHRVRRHTDHLVVAQCRRTAPEPLPQTSVDEFARLPRTRLEHGGRKFEFRRRVQHAIDRVSAPTPHVITLCAPMSRRNI